MRQIKLTIFGLPLPMGLLPTTITSTLSPAAELSFIARRLIARLPYGLDCRADNAECYRSDFLAELYTKPLPDIEYTPGPTCKTMLQCWTRRASTSRGMDRWRASGRNGWSGSGSYAMHLWCLIVSSYGQWS